MAAVPDDKAAADFIPTFAASSSSNLFTFSPNGAIQLVSNASCTYFCSYPSSLIWGDERRILFDINIYSFLNCELLLKNILIYLRVNINYYHFFNILSL